MSINEDEPIEGEEVIDGKNEGFGNIDFENLSGILKNVDISQIMNLLGSIDMNQISSLLGSFSGGGGRGDASPEYEASPFYGRGREYEVLNAIKPMVSAERGDLIDIILQIYTISRILK
ncbi:hypothetical protein CPAST_c29090 [Clostridium pasteurianum DSM 525 = ATCC 6013]|uniref:Uncharacterized protein n=1 Tax=Clostridium pasteurianum DSM 525 = ATCC 6013 TaxID=1262449 RepID=A0A0H3JB07_CLOPA|nr:hypothetical protein [Clostridium pasteurianum]AJA48975.1 hypothetical protein CPAST_c29090 [Clostridium pasteurianum DSM 525 = ATCC 6013]AJA52963.1 hypothetical protein CLPA_c29090 [Clostridium pasteurianum DSM 525 = ATCC 6013]AOZ76182.1 hypothetical protein AQ983_14140 [Clostridium pasteurianum DSM 525 = ATCC 6013]AOZ79978.1 hypothetical protein AQ984_14135 [Clostridium pasteurianum]ELP60271.1 hypothetical protein F502_06527 [Clostridium pasteurianum DSM 525 = ATCC 6013]